jgi:flagellar motility protein MotE (MotC chaperone)
MGLTLPPSKLLPATIGATSVMLAIKVVSLVVYAPTLGAVLSGTSQAVMAASVIPAAHAAGSETSEASQPQRASGAVGAAQSAEPAKPSSAPPAGVQTAAQTAVQLDQHADAGGAAMKISLHRSQIEEREQQVTQREAAVAAAEKLLTVRVAELQALQSHLQTLVNQDKAQDDAKWAGLVKLYEGMHPRDAAAIFNGLDKPLLLEILKRMKPAKASPIIALMQPENARQLTADLAAGTDSTTAATN